MDDARTHGDNSAVDDDDRPGCWDQHVNYIGRCPYCGDALPIGDKAVSIPGEDRESPAGVCSITRTCGKCQRGSMIRRGMAVISPPPPAYPHVCDFEGCGNTETLPRAYPYLQFYMEDGYGMMHPVGSLYLREPHL